MTSSSSQPSDPAPAVVLLSGGLDSATCLALARRDGFACHALAFDYGQRHRVELERARELATLLGAASFRVVSLDLRTLGGSALTGDVPVPKRNPGDSHDTNVIPVTYVPARNMTFLAIACGLAEVLGARDVYIGVNALDYSGYPDCRPEFLAAFERAASLGTKAGIEGSGVRIRAPLVGLTKAEIITLGASLGLDYAMTTSCYDPSRAGEACGRCDACHLRARGFAQAGIADTTRYAGGASE